MFEFPPTIILRHRKENLEKCSLRGLEGRPDMVFLTYPKDHLPDLASYICLRMDAPPLSKADAHLGLFLIDGTWRYAETMFKQIPLPHPFICRSLPVETKTAYPRRQEDDRGLASIEALYLAYLIMGRKTEGLLDHYYWKNEFLNSLNGQLCNRIA